MPRRHPWPVRLREALTELGHTDSRAFKKQSGTRAWERLAEVAPGLRPIHLDLYALYEDELDVAPPRGSSPGSTLRNPVPSS